MIRTLEAHSFNPHVRSLGFCSKVSRDGHEFNDGITRKLSLGVEPLKFGGCMDRRLLQIGAQQG